MSRNDFKQDDKWHAYLPLCNQLYFVCPKGMIQPEEVPGDVGLKWAIGKRVTTVKKAAHRECVPPMELFCYILMCRVRVVGPSFYEPETKETRIQKFKDWLAEKQENRELGKILKHSIAFEIDRIKTRNGHLNDEIERLKQVQQFARDLGIHSWDGEQEVKRKLIAFKQAVPDEYVFKLKEMAKMTKNLVDFFQTEPKPPIEYMI